MSDVTAAPNRLPAFTAAHFSLAAIGLMWTLPFLQPRHQFPLTSFYGEWLALVLGLLALVPLATRSFWRVAPVPAAVLPLLAFAGVLALQYALGRVAYGGQVMAAGLYVAWAALLMVMANGLRRSIDLDGIATVLAWFLAIGGALGAIFALLQHYQISDLPLSLIFPKSTSAVYGNLAQYNHFANYSTLALVSLAYLHASGRLHWAGVALAGAPLVYVIGLSSSRSAMLFLAFVLALSLLYVWRRGPAGRRLLACVAIFIAGFAVAQWIATLPGLGSSGGTETVTQRLIGGENHSSATNLAHRLQIAREARDMFLQAPLLGVGWGQFPWNDFEYRALQGRTLSTWPFNHAHNIVLQLLAETGLAGTLLVAGAALIWLAGLRRAVIDLPHWWLIALLGVIATHSLLEHPLWFAYFLGIAAVVAGLLSVAGPAARLERVVPPLMALVLAAVALYALSVFANYRDFERLFAPRAPQPGSAEFVSVVSRAQREALLTPYAELAIASAMALDRERLEEKLALNGRAMRFAPIASVVYRQAMLLALAGKQEAAQEQFVRAARVYPGDLRTALKIMSEVATRHPAEVTPLIKLALHMLAGPGGQ